jgi:GAF domain-containing protein
VSNEAKNEKPAEIGLQLQDLVLESLDVGEFLDELAAYSAERLSKPGLGVYCGITVIRRKRALTIASSNTCARAMDELQNTFGEGPCLTAMKEMATVHVPDLRNETRWPDYVHAVSGQGILSILGVPLPLEGETRAALNVYSSQAHGFSGEDIAGAEDFAERISKSLRLALRIAQLTEARNDLAAAMESRTTIDLAVGAIMAQNRCSQEAAQQMLNRASNSRNVKLREVAARIIASITDDAAIHTHFDQ